MTQNKNSKSSTNSQKSEVPNWNLSDLYKNIDDKKITDDLKIIDSRVERFVKKYHVKIAKINAQDLNEAIKEYELIGEMMGKIATFSYLIYASDLVNEKYLNFNQNISEKLNKFENRLIFFTLGINKINEKDFKKLSANKVLKKYQPFLRDVRIFKPYQLSNELEKYALDKNITSRQAFIRLFDEIMAGLKFNYRDKILNSQEIFDLMSHHDQQIRKDAGSAISKTFKDNIKTLAFITNILAKDKAIDDEYRGFANPIQSRNIANYVSDEIVEILSETVQQNYAKISHRYYKIKARILGKKYLNFYDRNAPLKNGQESRYSWSQAKNIVLESYDEFSSQMSKIAKLFFDNNWIDAQARSGKDSGAFSHSAVPSVHPYILMNFQGKTRDIMTLAHELGHGIHQYLARQQGFLMAQTPLTLAETASVFGEQLTFQKILSNEKDLNQKKFIIANKIEDMINTVVRQIAFLEFEKKVHAERKKHEITIENLGNFWLEVQRKSLGDIFKFDDDYRNFWCYIPHFIHSPFYVYSYAFGDCLVNSLYGIYQGQKIKNFENKYIDMLKLGGTLHHQEMLAPFGLKIDNKLFWQEGLDVLIKYIDQLEEMF